VACADQEGAQVMVRRIQGQLNNCAYVQNARLASETSFTMVHVPSRENGMPWEQIVGDVANTIEDIVKTKILQKEEVSHDGKEDSHH
jgi:hypothetical protein